METLSQYSPKGMHLLFFVNRDVRYIVLLDKCIGKPICVILRTENEFKGILRGFDDYFSMYTLLANIYSKHRSYS